MAIAALLSALAGCVVAVKPVPPPLITISGTEVAYRGSFIADSATRVQAVAASHPVRTLRISSLGGDVNSAIDTALWVHRNGISVVVDGPCLSSCANYVFLAGRDKHIVEQGYVGWHGNAEHLRYLHALGKSTLGAQSRPMLERMAMKERAFYAEIGVNGYIAWFGKLAPYDTWNFYFMSKEDMEYFGVTDLHVRPDYAPVSLLIPSLRKKRDLRLLKVDRSVTNPADSNWIIRPMQK